MSGRAHPFGQLLRILMLVVALSAAIAALDLRGPDPDVPHHVFSEPSEQELGAGGVRAVLLRWAWMTRTSRERPSAASSAAAERPGSSIARPVLSTGSGVGALERSRCPPFKRRWRRRSTVPGRCAGTPADPV